MHRAPHRPTFRTICTLNVGNGQGWYRRQHKKYEANISHMCKGPTSSVNGLCGFSSRRVDRRVRHFVRLSTASSHELLVPHCKPAALLPSLEGVQSLWPVQLPLELARSPAWPSGRRAACAPRSLSQRDGSCVGCCWHREGLGCRRPRPGQLDRSAPRTRRSVGGGAARGRSAGARKSTVSRSCP
jgi:hypothetical protein